MRGIKSHFRKIAIFLAFLALAPLLTGCSIPFLQKEPQKVNLVYWGLWEPSEVVKPLIEKYQSQNPNITISYEKQSPVQYRERLTAKIEKGEGPDIFRFHNTWVPMLKDVVDQVPESVMSSSEFKETFYEVMAEDLELGDKFVGIPLEFDGLGLYWNIDIFKAAGISQPPTTWDELRQRAADLTVKDETGRILTAGVSLGTASNVDHFSDILALMMLQNGTDLSKIDASLDDNGRNLGADSLDFYVLFAKDENRVWDETLEPSTLKFAKGELAMYFGPSWRSFQFKEANPALNFAIAPLPQLPEFKVGWASYWAEGVSSKSKHKKESWAFLKFLSEAENLKSLYTQASKVRLFGGPYSRVDLANLVQNDPLVGAYITDAPQAYSFPLASRTFDNGLNDRLIKYLEDAINSVLTGKDSTKTLQDTRKGFDQVLSQYDLISQSQK